jgi:hypothetical protein
MAGRLVRNEEATGSIPVSSTIFSISYGPPKTQVCPTLSQDKIQSPSGFASNTDELHFRSEMVEQPRRTKEEQSR